ncbi:hypothetical protein OsJ_36499 [Oryza sativa Japonica Group]|uniref:Disease resistance R13L4/SHOC-2-like LRR domain-containing protein n=1 Tax=Oryza sativa subsp. japonica TaxID=39947 RepID=B9GDR7_ORYSJ|nr:hypothetical protein OsJ_36499 [Oryza sativa Japonica Group]
MLTKSEKLIEKLSMLVHWMSHSPFSLAFAAAFSRETVFKESVNLDQEDLELIEEAKLILKKCKGLPLAIVTIGGFLASRPKTALEWRKLNEHISAELETNLELEAIRAVLNISYDGLPYHLKSCFLYLSIFPQDDKISRKRLVHDIMREIAISKSKEENLVLRLEGGRRLHNHDTVRHLSITNSSEDWETDVGELKTTVDMSRIRSLTVFGEWRPFFISDKMRLLRVLDLEDTKDVRNHHIKQIGELLHLRYLSLRGCMRIAYLPDSLGNLRQLETLDVRDTFILRLPKTITNLRKLKYLRAIVDKITYEGIAEELPEVMRNMLCIFTAALLLLCLACTTSSIGMLDDEINTREICSMFCCSILPSIAMRLQGNGVVAPRGLRRLTALHTLVTGVNKKNSKKFFSVLAALSRLESLSLLSKGKPGLCGCLDAQEKFSPPKDVKSLKLQGNLVELPKWIKQLNNLVKLKLSETMLKDHDAAIQVLGMLPNLTILCLSRESFHSLEGEELNFSEGSFKSLVVLELNFSGSKCVKFEQGAFLNLELLLLSVYYEEVETKFSGLEFLQSIKEVQIDGYCPNRKGLKKDLLPPGAESLSLLSKGEPGLWGCLDADEEFSPPMNLKSLKLQGNLVELPKWIRQLNNLVKLKLSETMLKDHNATIQVLGELRNLTILCLSREPFHSLEGGELNFSEGSFISLVVLELHFGGSKCVKFEQGAFLNLELLLLSVYYEEVETKFSGLEFLPGIKEVRLHGEFYARNEQSAPRLKEDLLAQLSENPKKPILKTSGCF